MNQTESRAAPRARPHEEDRTQPAPRVLRIHPDDDVAVALVAVPAGAAVEVDGVRVVAREIVPRGHKIALRHLGDDEEVVKYGAPIGRTTAAVPAGSWVHVHNLRTTLGDSVEYRYAAAEGGGGDVASGTEAGSAVGGRSRAADRAGAAAASERAGIPTFRGYVRPDGRVGTRNEIWIINTVGCVNRSAERIAAQARERFRHAVDGVHAFPHPYGCSQLGDDLAHTQRVLAGLIRHPNAGGVLVLGLGCENNQIEALLRQAGPADRDRIVFFNSQDVADEVEEGVEAVGRIVDRIRSHVRSVRPVSDLVLGLKCGGSDAFSGITANPLLGRIADRLTALGGTAILTEVPEMFGAEQILMNRAADEHTFRRIVELIEDFKAYFVRHGQPIYENPSPGNREGGLTTLEEKSLGAIQKGGRAMVTQVLRYGEPVRPGGLALLEAPGNDGVSVTAEVASGANLILFTTGRGTPLGFPAPTLKISSNTEIFEKKAHWIDFNAGAGLDGTAGLDDLADDLMALIRRVASGEELARNEVNDYREIAIWKEGVTL